MEKVVRNRYLEIDLLRGIAVILMIVFHFFYISNYLGVTASDIKSVFWVIIAKVVQFSFIGLAGVALSISKNRNGNFHLKQSKRGVLILCGGFLVTLFTWIFTPDRIVIIGILHLIGLGILLFQFLARKKFFSLALGLFVLIFGLAIQDMGTVHSVVLEVIGFEAKGFHPLDYFPVFPWASVMLFGIFLGNLIYKNGEKRFGIFDKADISGNWVVKFMALLGRNSLLIYLVQFPVIIGVVEGMKWLI